MVMQLKPDPHFYRPACAPVPPSSQPAWRVAIEYWPIAAGVLTGAGLASLFVWALVRLAARHA